MVIMFKTRSFGQGRYMYDVYHWFLTTRDRLCPYMSDILDPFTSSSSRTPFVYFRKTEPCWKRR